MKKIFFILSFLMCVSYGFATHIVGGDLTVKHVSGNNFTISLRFYRDCGPTSTGFDNSLWVGLFDKVTNARVDSFRLTLVSITPLSLGDQCYANNLCVEEGLFTASATIANNPNGYYLSWLRCCRNGIINNIVAPGAAGFVYYAEIPNPAIANSSPTFGSYTKTYMCNGVLNTINFAATDLEGDNLVYSIVNPLNGTSSLTNIIPYVTRGPYSSVSWQSPYSLSNILGSNPNVSIHPTTGILTVTPTTLGVFVFAIKVEEYRAGVKIGEIRRDIQYQVISCINPLTPGPAVVRTCSSPTQTVTVSSSSPVSSYQWTGPGVISGGNTASAVVDKNGLYTVTASSPAGCTYTASVSVTDNMDYPNAVSGGSLTISCQNTSGTVSVSSTTPNVNYAWSGPSGGISGVSTAPSTTVALAGTYTVTVTNPQNNCKSTATVIVIGNTTSPNLSTTSPVSINCSTQNTTVSANSTTANVNYAWAGPAGGISGVTTAPSATVALAGTYTVTVTDPQNNCKSTATITVTGNTTSPNLSTSVPASINCSSQNTTVSANSTTPNVNYVWAGPTGGISGVTTAPSATVALAGTYTVTVTNPQNNCKSTATVIVTGNTTSPNLSTSAPASINCSTQTTTVTANSTTANVNYLWAGPTGGISGAATAPSATVALAGTYTVTVTNPQNNCKSTATVTVTVNTTLPNLSTSALGSLNCSTQTTTVTANSTTSNVNFVWAGPSGGILGTNLLPTITVNTGGTYTVTATNTTNNCSTTATVTISQNITPPVLISPTASLITCKQSNSTINIGSPVAGLNYVWTAPNAINFVSGDSTASPIVNATGTYTVVATNPVNGCTNSATIYVNNNISNPSASANSNLTLNCYTLSGTINAISNNTNVDYSWVGPSSNSITANGNAANPTVGSPGVYTVTVTDKINGCSATATTTVNSNITPPSIIAGNPLTLTCNVATGTISVNSNTPNVTYLWMGPSANSVSNTSIASPTVNTAGTYTVVVSDTINKCTSSATVQVSIDNSIPNLTAITSLTLTCYATSDTLFANSTTPNISYNWTGPIGGINSGDTTATPVVDLAGTYTVTATNLFSGCTNTTTVNVVNNIISPPITAASPQLLNCTALSDTIIITSPILGLDYAWTGPGILSGNTTSYPIVNQPGLYTVVATNPVNGCTSVTTVLVVKDTLSPNLSMSGSITLTCATTSSALSANSTTPGVVYNWTGPLIISGNGTSTPVVGDTGVYAVVITNPLNGCKSTDSIKINGNTVVPNVNAGPGLLLTCLVTSGTISASSTTQGVSYYWSGSIVSGGNSPTPTISSPGTYTVTVTDSINGCTNTATVTVASAPLPVATVNADVTIIWGNDTVLNASGGGSYLWLPSAGLSCATCASPTANPTETTTYCVTVTDQYGCMDTACVKVNVYDPCPLTNNGFIVPNIFTPNGDGKNDILLLKDWNNECIIEFAFEIYDRWGLKMFESSGANVNWDGRTVSGMECPAGTYYYVVNVKKARAEEKVYRGFVTLAR